MFIICCHPDATEDPALRLAAAAAGASMVTASAAAAAAALGRVAAARLGGGLSCAWCGLAGLTVRGYWEHQPLYHIYEGIIEAACPVCGSHTSNLARHLHDAHPPPGTHAEVRTGVFALVVVPRPADGKFLVVQEFAGQGFWVPGGGADAGESLTAAAAREAREEAGVEIAPRGVCCFEAHRGGAWRRAIFYAEPIGADADAPRGPGAPPPDCSLPAPRDSPKTVPDFESAGACWASSRQLAGPGLRVRSAAEMAWVQEVAAGFEPGPLEVPPEWREVFRDIAL
ncbi:MAG: hypothetical protein J3K34DRAFT_260467 [Monoraphidium minutum]|nr:MAG: hypothetical protein J3K34DRAFT_260467 [Monoraphidium minutum]